jgi:VIT1/CCC1 family predicted Fe2+/Mn2+ transporter
LPFLLLTNKLQALAITIATVVLIIYLFNYYIATAKDLDFKSRFWEMTSISLGVAAFSFVVGFLLKNALGIDV